MKTKQKESKVYYIGVVNDMIKAHSSVISKYECASCGKKILSESGFAPFCPYCEGIMDEVKVVSKEINKDELLKVKCKSCDSVIEFEEGLYSEDNPVIKCSVCGSDLALDTADVDTYIGNQEGDDEESPQQEDNQNSQPQEDNQQQQEEEDNQQQQQQEEDNSEEITIFSTLGVDKIEDNKISFASNQNSLVVLYNEVPVATIEYDNIPSDKAKATFKNKPEVFNNSLKVAMSELGFEQAIKEFGGNMLTVKVNPELVKKEEVNQVKSQLERDYSEKITSFKDDFLQSLSIAVVGINKNFFKDTDNALKATFWEELNAVGIENPEVIIDKVFAVASEDFFKTVINKAMEIMKKPVDVRNELSKTIIESNYIIASSNVSTKGNVAFKSKLAAGNVPLSTAPFVENYIDKTTANSKKEKFKKAFKF